VAQAVKCHLVGIKPLVQISVHPKRKEKIFEVEDVD
jgi:hypothetical protein